VPSPSSCPKCSAVFVAFFFTKMGGGTELSGGDVLVKMMMIAFITIN